MEENSIDKCLPRVPSSSPPGAASSSSARMPPPISLPHAVPHAACAAEARLRHARRARHPVLGTHLRTRQDGGAAVNQPLEQISRRMSGLQCGHDRARRAHIGHGAEQLPLCSRCLPRRQRKPGDHDVLREGLHPRFQRPPGYRAHASCGR